MASNKLVILIATVLVLLPAIAMAKDIVVGDESGWKLNFDYQAWAKDKVFRVGDTLVFNYNPPAHNVYKVNGTGFQDCPTKPPKKEALTSGNDKVELQTAGKKWYICGVSDHCDQGMKLAINVMDKSSAARGIVFLRKPTLPAGRHLCHHDNCGLIYVLSYTKCDRFSTSICTGIVIFDSFLVQ